MLRLAGASFQGPVCPGKGYERLKKASDAKLAEESSKLEEKIKKATERDARSHALQDVYRGGDEKKSRAAFLKWYQELRLGQHPAFHFIICLDESWSMEGEMFEAAHKAAADFMKAAAVKHQRTASAVSMIMFSVDSRVLCSEIPLQQHTDCSSNISYQGGTGTEFGPPLEDAMNLVQMNQDKYANQVIVLFTDGEASFPEEEANSIKRFRDSGGKLEFYAIAETKAEALEEICETLYPSSTSSHCQSQVTPEAIPNAFQMTWHHVDMAFVQA